MIELEAFDSPQAEAGLKRPKAPYPGLRPFRPDEESIFFGRDEQIEEVIARLERDHFVAIVGESGTGKSSIVIAGLLPALRSGFLRGGGSEWSDLRMRPGNRPLESLAKALLCCPETNAIVGDIPEARLVAQLRSNAHALAEILRQAQVQSGSSILLVLDQFEEIFRNRSEGDPGEPIAFVSAILRALNHQQDSNNCGPGVYLILTMRSDYLGECALFPGLAEALNDSQYLTPRLTRAQQQEAIELPLKAFDAEIEPALVSALLEDTAKDNQDKHNPAEEAGDKLPLMQHALMCLWIRAVEQYGDSRKVLSLSALHDLGQIPEGVTAARGESGEYGGLGQVLDNHCDRVLDIAQRKLKQDLNLSSEESDRLVSRIFKSLTNREGNKTDSRQSRDAEAVLAMLALPGPEPVLAAVEIFREDGHNLLIVETPGSGQTDQPGLTPTTKFDLVHESLIRRWRMLRGWADDERKLIDDYRALVREASRYEKADGKTGPMSQSMYERYKVWPDHRDQCKAWLALYYSDDDEDWETELDLVLKFIVESGRAFKEEEAKLSAEQYKRIRDTAVKVKRAANTAVIVTVAIVTVVLIVPLTAAYLVGREKVKKQETESSQLTKAAQAATQKAQAAAASLATVQSSVDLANRKATELKAQNDAYKTEAHDYLGKKAELQKAVVAEEAKSKAISTNIVRLQTSSQALATVFDSRAKAAASDLRWDQAEYWLALAAEANPNYSKGLLSRYNQAHQNRWLIRQPQALAFNPPEESNLDSDWLVMIGGRPTLIWPDKKWLSIENAGPPIHIPYKPGVSPSWEGDTPNKVHVVGALAFWQDSKSNFFCSRISPPSPRVETTKLLDKSTTQVLVGNSVFTTAEVFANARGQNNSWLRIYQLRGLTPSLVRKIDLPDHQGLIDQAVSLPTGGPISVVTTTVAHGGLSVGRWDRSGNEIGGPALLRFSDGQTPIAVNATSVSPDGNLLIVTCSFQKSSEAYAINLNPMSIAPRLLPVPGFDQAIFRDAQNSYVLYHWKNVLNMVNTATLQRLTLPDPDNLISYDVIQARPNEQRMLIARQELGDICLYDRNQPLARYSLPQFFDPSDSESDSGRFLHLPNHDGKVVGWQYGGKVILWLSGNPNSLELKKIPPSDQVRRELNLDASGSPMLVKLPPGKR